MKFIRRVGILLLLVAVVCAWILYRVVTPYNGFSGERFVDVPRGTSTTGIADLLAKNGIIRSRWDFLAARLTERDRTLQAGEYKFDHPSSPMEALDRIARGDVFYYALVVPEGKNMFDIAAAVEGLGLMKSSAFLEAARNPTMIRDLDPQAPSLEGYLFPNTYKLSRHATAESICRMMTGKFREVWHSIEAGGGSVHDTITMASLVEKEGKLPEERPKIAAVFENRLRIGMKLDCDPTTIYAALLQDRYRGTIYRSDLDSDHPYNTYRHAGLPPGPIANPGLESIHAVLHPGGGDALYFVLRPDGSGSHQFSSTIAEHDAATQQYRNARKQVR